MLYTYRWLNGLHDLVERISRTKSLIVLPLLQKKIFAKSFPFGAFVHFAVFCLSLFFFANNLVWNVNFVIAINNLFAHTFYFKTLRSIICPVFFLIEWKTSFNFYFEYFYLWHLFLPLPIQHGFLASVNHIGVIIKLVFVIVTVTVVYFALRIRHYWIRQHDSNGFRKWL